MVARAMVYVAVVVVGLAAVGGGFVAGYEYRGSNAANGRSVDSSTLSVLAAGTLDTVFPQLANLLANESPGVSVPSAAQTYEGSLDVATAITATGVKADVAALADYRLIPQVLEPAYASYEVVFGTTPEVLAYNASLPAFAGINSTNWGEKLESAASSGPPFGIWNASTDPNGYNEIFSLELQGTLYNGSSTALYGHFYSGGAGQVAVGNPATTRVESESMAATLVSTGVVCAVVTYRAYAVVHHMSYVSFNPIVGLVANNSTALADYANVSTEITTSSGGLASVGAAPVLFAATVPLDAPNASLGAAFVHLLLSPQGAALLSAGGAFTPIFPGWADRPSAVPSVLAPDVVPLPGWAAKGLL
jgi:molybdate/tungstate transport system substrate-binding protein